MNEHVALERNGDKIALLGIENWSNKARFPKHGRMDLAHKGTEEYPFKILMSHDPSHWEAQVQPHYPDVDLMLSGHTHGMQFGIDIPGFKWSPVQYMYKQWAGLYENEKQKPEEGMLPTSERKYVLKSAIIKMKSAKQVLGSDIESTVYIIIAAITTSHSTVPFTIIFITRSE